MVPQALPLKGIPPAMGGAWGPSTAPPGALRGSTPLHYLQQAAFAIFRY
jgi:hypothetical protein